MLSGKLTTSIYFTIVLRNEMKCINVRASLSMDQNEKGGPAAYFELSNKHQSIITLLFFSLYPSTCFFSTGHWPEYPKQTNAKYHLRFVMWHVKLHAPMRQYSTPGRVGEMSEWKNVTRNPVHIAMDFVIVNRK